MFADDTNVTFTACSIPELQHDMNIDLQFLQNWLIANKLTLNVLKTEFMLAGSRQRVATLTQELDLSINGISLKVDEFLTWDAHISSVSKKVTSGIGVIKKIKPFVPTSNLISVYQSIVEPYLDYCSVAVWDDISDQLTDKLQILQNRAARVITGADYRTPSSVLLNKLGWSSLKEKRHKQKALMMFKIMNGMTPAYLEDIFTRNIGRSVFYLRISRSNLALPGNREPHEAKKKSFDLGGNRTHDLRNRSTVTLPTELQGRTVLRGTTFICTLTFSSPRLTIQSRPRLSLCDLVAQSAE